MAHDALLWFPTGAITGPVPRPIGENQIDAAHTGAISLGESWTFSLENKLDISSITTGAGSGKAEFQEFTIKKQVDTASSVLFLACGAGAVFNGVQLYLRKATGETQGTGTTNTYLIWTFNLFAVEKIEWSYGEPVPEENVTFKFGACTIQYYQQEGATLVPKSPQMWSQITNSSSMGVGPVAA
jgi:type VI secretion system secreted protein Hcp